MATRLVLLSAILVAMNTPMATMPFHCFPSVSACLLRTDTENINGANARKLKSIWHVVNSSGNEKPCIPSTYLLAKLSTELRERYNVMSMAYCALPWLNTILKRDHGLDNIWSCNMRTACVTKEPG